MDEGDTVEEPASRLGGVLLVERHLEDGLEQRRARRP